jgi:hypothetical protein
MTIKECLTDAAARCTFRWHWKQSKPGIFFLNSSATHHVYEVYNWPDAIKLSQRIEAAGGWICYDSLRAASDQKIAFLTARDGAPYVEEGRP